MRKKVYLRYLYNGIVKECLSRVLYLEMTDRMVSSVHPIERLLIGQLAT